MNILNENNPYGFRYNVNHPMVRELYTRFKDWKEIGHYPLSDEERREFEGWLDKSKEIQREIANELQRVSENEDRHSPGDGV